jgi:hypothetical protein
VNRRDRDAAQSDKRFHGKRLGTHRTIAWTSAITTATFARFVVAVTAESDPVRLSETHARDRQRFQLQMRFSPPQVWRVETNESTRPTLLATSRSRSLSGAVVTGDLARSHRVVAF